MARMRIHWLATIATLTLVVTLGLVGASSASAAPFCKHYDSYGNDSGTVRNVTVCAAVSTDYPSYSGWGRIKTSTAGMIAGVCGHEGLLPMDLNDPLRFAPCLPPPHDEWPAPVEYGWHWTSYGWVKGAPLVTGTRAYFAPYASGWRWGWTAETGWFALPASDAYFLWYA